MPAPDFEAGAGVPEVLIRGCELEDFEEVLSLLGQLWSDLELDAAASREVFGRLLEKDNCVLTCAVAEGRVVGFCDFNVRHSLWQQGKLAYVDELVVEESFRGRGIGAGSAGAKRRGRPGNSDVRASSLTPPFTAPRRTASTTAWVGKGARSSSARTLPDP